MNDSNYPENEDFLDDLIFQGLTANHSPDPDGSGSDGSEPDTELPVFPEAAPSDFDPLIFFDESGEDDSGFDPLAFYEVPEAEHSDEPDSPAALDEPANPDELTASDSTPLADEQPAEETNTDFSLEEPYTQAFLEEPLPVFPPESEMPVPEDGASDAEYEDVSDNEDGYQVTDGNLEATEEERVIHSNRNRPVKRGRPRRRKGSGLLGIPHLIASALWLVIILAIGVSLGRVVWVCASDVLAFGRTEKEVTISVTSSDTIDTIAQKLSDAGLVRYPQLFKLYADLSHAESKITTGTFTLNTIYDYHALVSQMSPKSNNRVVIEDVLIPEGFSCRQIFALLERKGVCSAAELEEYAANGELKEYWFLENVERGDKYCLEGFLFPDTYDFYENSSPKAALEKMLNGFNARITEEIYSTLPQLNERLSTMMRNNGCTEEYIAANQLSLRDVITVASLIEKEMANTDEAPIIASVIYNRLTQDQAYERYLNIDAAIFYALGEHKEALTAEDLQIDSPYNTYTNSGLVPGPIASPGLACINAALNPQSTDYYYYVLDPSTGNHHFSRTYEEHEKFIASLGGTT